MQVRGLVLLRLKAVRLKVLSGPYLPVPIKVFLSYRPSLRFWGVSSGRFVNLCPSCAGLVRGLGLGFLTWWKGRVGFLLKEG
jgi:hypothetical protein